ncbi:MAG: ribosomal protein L7/L12 [Planctomycetes bacterium]|nr:ribosomal protein L7/L12 [Planctomycetota bacterium]
MGSPGSAPTTSPTADFEADPEYQAAVRQGKKIQAIKRCRELTGLGLKDAKAAVDALWS